MVLGEDDSERESREEESFQGPDTSAPRDAELPVSFPS